MTSAQALVAFTFAATLLTLTPGLDTAMVLRSAAVDGARKAVYAAVGIGLGCLAWGVLVAVGLGALLAASETAFTLLKWIGAAYLFGLGVQLLFRPRRSLHEAGPGQRAASALLSLRRGFLTNALNPKVGVFYVTFLPQFIPAGVPAGPFALMLAAVHVLLGLGWFGMLIVATAPVRRILARPKVLAGLDRVTGGVFLGFSLKLALSRP